MVKAAIRHVAIALPVGELSNERLAVQFPEWSVEKIAKKTGIRSRRVANADEYASTLATQAVRSLFHSAALEPADVDFVIVCTQSADFYMPVTAALVQADAGIPNGAGALDINLGCSGYVYGIGLAKGLVESGVARKVVLVTADTYTKYLNPEDKSVRTIFGDGATATLIDDRGTAESLSHFVYGTDGNGAGSLIVPNGAMRSGTSLNSAADPATRGLTPSGFDLYMDGPAIFTFTIENVPALVQQTLDSAGMTVDDIDLFVLHQANEFMLTHLRSRMAIPADKFVIEMEDVGNTVSSTIPIVLMRLTSAGRLRRGMRVMVVGFGVGLSWGGAIVTW